MLATTWTKLLGLQHLFWALDPGPWGPCLREMLSKSANRIRNQNLWMQVVILEQATMHWEAAYMYNMYHNLNEGLQRLWSRWTFPSADNIPNLVTTVYNYGTSYMSGIYNLANFTTVSLACLNRKNNTCTCTWANIIHVMTVPRKLTRSAWFKLTIKSSRTFFVWKMQTLTHININEFTVLGR